MAANRGHVMEDAASPHLARLAAHARPAGGPAAAEARAYCADTLRSLGFTTSEHSFEFSAFPGAWGAPLSGAVASLACIALFIGRHARLWSIAGIAGAAIAFAALGLMGSRGVLGLPLMRRRGVNLQAIRGGTEPTVWLVAHIDSKWQPVSMVARIGGVVVTTLAGVGLVVMNLVPSSSDAAAAVLLIVAWLGSVPLMLSIVRDHGIGAVDNASGVAVVLEAAAAVPATASIGVLITDGEEFALAGARAWAKSRTSGGGVALNCDGVDDVGRLAIMHVNPAPTAVIAAMERAIASAGERARVLRLLPGVLTDSIALSAAGWRTVTLSRGSLRTLRRIHTSRDSLDHMRGTGIALAAKVLAATATELA